MAPPDSDLEPVELVLVRGRQVHRLDERGRAIEVLGQEREILLGEATAARVLFEFERQWGRSRGRV